MSPSRHRAGRRGLLTACLGVALLGGAGAPAGADPPPELGPVPGPGDLSCEPVDEDGAPVGEADDLAAWECEILVDEFTDCSWDRPEWAEEVDDQMHGAAGPGDSISCLDEDGAEFLCHVHAPDVYDDRAPDVAFDDAEAAAEPGAEPGDRDRSGATAYCSAERLVPDSGDRLQPDGSRLVDCRNERHLWFDEHDEFPVDDDVPEWWLEEVRHESDSSRQGFEGRGETELYLEDTDNLGARGCDLAGSPPAPPGEGDCDEINETKSEEHRNPLESRTGLVPDDCWGTYPTDRYVVTWNPESKFNVGGWRDRLLGWTSMLLFAFAKLAVNVALWMVRVAFDFDVGEYRETVADLAGTVDRELVHLGGHELRLVTVAWFVLVSGLGFLALRGRTGRAGAELLTSVLLAGLVTVLLGPLLRPMPTDEESTPAYAVDGYMDSFVSLVNQSSRAPLQAAHGRDPNEELDRTETEELLRTTLGTVHEEFVEAPALYINWGTETFAETPVPGAEQSCAEVQANILTVPDPPRTWPSHYMARHGCIREARFNSDMSDMRVAAVALVTLVALLVAAVLALTAMTLLLTKALAAVLFVALPVAAVTALLPGEGRKMAWWWLGALVQLWLASVAMGCVLLLLQFAVHATATVTATAGLGLAERWVGLLAVVGTLYVLRRRLAAASRQVASRVSTTLGDLAGAADGPAGGARQPSPNAPDARSVSGAAPDDGEQQPAGAGSVDMAANQAALTGAGVPGTVGTAALVAPLATRTAVTGGVSTHSPEAEGFDLSGVDKAAAAAGIMGTGAVVAGTSLVRRMGVLRTVALANIAGLPLPGLGVVGGAGAIAAARYSLPLGYRWWRGQYGRRHENQIGQAYRASITEYEDQRQRRQKDLARYLKDPSRFGHDPAAALYDPRRYGVRLQTPSYGPLPTDREADALVFPMRLGRAVPAIKKGQLVAANSEVLYKPDQSGLPNWRLPRKVRGPDGRWLKVRPPPVLGRPLLRPVLRRPPPDLIDTYPNAARLRRNGPAWGPDGAGITDGP